MPNQSCIKSFILLVGALFSNLSQAFEVGKPILSGVGCPPGSARAAILEDGTTISILFDNFISEVKKGFHAPNKTSRKCQFKIPVQIPPGYTILPLNIIYSGFAQITGKNFGSITTTGPLIQLGNKSFTRPPIVSQIKNTSDNFQVKQVVNVNKLANCIKLSDIEFSTEIQLHGGALPHKGPGFFLEDALLAIDSADIGNAFESIQIQLQIEKCK